MKWAIAMADRVKAEREKTYQEHTQITDAMNALAAAARKAHDASALEFAQAAVADLLNDLELIEPMSIVIGDYLKAKLPPASRQAAGAMVSPRSTILRSIAARGERSIGRARRNPSVRPILRYLPCNRSMNGGKVSRKPTARRENAAILIPPIATVRVRHTRFSANHAKPVYATVVSRRAYRSDCRC